MRCEVCGIGRRHDRLVRYSLSLGERFVVVEGVPASVCDNCGEVSFAPETVDRIQKTVGAAGVPKRFLETPVYDLVSLVSKLAQ